MFPTLVYKNGGPHQRKGGTFDYMPVLNEDTLKLALSDGWFATLPEAIEGVKVVDEVSPPTREELETKAKELELKFDGRTTDKKLGDLIEAALKG